MKYCIMRQKFGSHCLIICSNDSFIRQYFRCTVSYILAHRIRVSEILPWDRKSYFTYAILPRMSSNIIPGCVAQSVMCLATDACLTADPGVESSITARSHTFLETDHEIRSSRDKACIFPSRHDYKHQIFKLHSCF